MPRRLDHGDISSQDPSDLRHLDSMVAAPIRERNAGKERNKVCRNPAPPGRDRASALVLGMVARRLAGLPVALLAACRTGQPGFFDQGNLPGLRQLRAPRPAAHSHQ